MNERTAAGPLAIDVISDVVCPWCFVGKRRLEAALALVAAEHPAVKPVVNWHPFEGVDRRAYMEAKFGGAGGTSAAHSRLAAVGSTLGIDFRFDAITRQPNTRDAHRLVLWAQAGADADPLVEALFRAFFIDGRDIGMRDELARIAAQAGFDGGAAAAMLDSQEFTDRVARTEDRARELGVSGVPFFIFGERVALSGAHEPSTLADAIAQALRQRASDAA